MDVLAELLHGDAIGESSKVLRFPKALVHIERVGCSMSKAQVVVIVVLNGVAGLYFGDRCLDSWGSSSSSYALPSSSSSSSLLVVVGSGSGSYASRSTRAEPRFLPVLAALAIVKATHSVGV
jgi:hypothetical protein